MQTDVNKNANRNVNKKIAPKKNLAPEKKRGERKPVYKKNSNNAHNAHLLTFCVHCGHFQFANK